uniref:CRAL-TRIO domain-containing protein n=1 Tax=Aegilops tauschii TaxID=37682 RepID=M8C3J7_AEGTA
MSFLWKSSNGGTTEKTLTLEEQQEKINEVRKQLEEPSSLAIQGFLSDASILRFLRARNWNVQKSSKMLKSAVKWRAAYKPEMISWEEIAHEAETGKIYRADYKDTLGRTVLVLRPGLENTTSGKEQIKYLVYSLEKAIMNLTDDQEKMVWMIDFQGWTMGSTPLKVTRETIVKPFLDHETSKKVKFVYSNDKESQKIMAEVFDMDKLDSAFGGRNLATFEYSSYAEQMKEDDKKMQSNDAGSDASSEASFYSGTDSPKHGDGEHGATKKACAT